MFERYTEAARKAVSFARFEASQTGSREIETEHLLLGILRELPPSLERVLYKPADTASRTVTPEGIEGAVAARAGVPVAAVKRVLEQRGTGELERIAAELASQVPEEPWVPFLAAYLACCSVEEAEALAQAIRAGCSGRKPL